jgi:hypothetical protein
MLIDMIGRTGTDIPLNFHGVRLGKKEIAAVHKVRPDYDQDVELREAGFSQSV